ncbi:MAG TPA: metallophosphoesterase family protein [Chitinophagales bacterium]|nr:metallophosphatase family protein [Chitinophagales bacterium]HMX05063.1 metallophosphoesterase family protein [Chitinophagales bacterium]HMZ88308.1 metallophosphoesterase family protein [Chitinophagales bacterium]HNA56909.1 metallophosphoesterase family protein [Chitinophagales bacterium]HNF67826.1 metallophosphoesterase family protein [Chitinophagales bacterium]
MKIALFSDIHANLPAMEACFADIDTRRPDAVYCLGDLVGYNIWPNEVIRLIRDRGIPVIFGNYDQGIGLHSDECGCAYKTDIEKEMGKISISFTNSIVGDDERNYLRSLPAHIRVDHLIQEETMSLLLVHGSPRRVNEYLFEDREEKSMLRIMQQANADIMCFGHTHKPYHRILQDGDRYRHAINIGSVGKPKDGDPRGCYVMLTIDEHTSVHAEDAVQVEFVRFQYDVEKAAHAVEESPLPNAYADMLRKGY